MKMMSKAHWLLLVLSLLDGVAIKARRMSLGPSVDPGVFVLTHVDSCRSGKGYCVLGFNCAIDKDFVSDDLGGNCDGLKRAFSPEASFVCCRENPQNLRLLVTEPTTTTSTTTTTITTTSSEPETTIRTVTSLVTETEIFTEVVTKVEEVTEIKPVTEVIEISVQSEAKEPGEQTEAEVLRPGTVMDDPSLLEEMLQEQVATEDPQNVTTDIPTEEETATDCYAAILLGIECKQSVAEKEEVGERKEPEKAVRKSTPMLGDGDSVNLAELLEEIKTAQIKFEPERESTNAAPISILEPMSDLIDEGSTIPTDPSLPQECGQLGGQGVFQAFGLAAEGLLPDLVANWVTGHLSGEKRSEFIGGGTVTSTVIYCWMAAIVSTELNSTDKDKLLCTGTLVKPDLVITSASCTVDIMKKGLNTFQVVLGDSNLQTELPFGVQTHNISEVILHETFKPFSDYHDHDIGLIRLATPASLDKTVCLLCLPTPQVSLAGENCSVISYGKRTLIGVEDAFKVSAEASDSVGILRKANFQLTNRNSCHEKFGVAEESDDQFVCGQSLENEKNNCLVSLGGGSPLICPVTESDNSTSYFLAGMVTMGSLCPTFQELALFTNIGQHLSWIERKYEKLT